MKALSQSEYGEIRSLYESMYTSKEVITEELIDEIIDELVEELISEGVDEEEAYSLVEEATDTYIDEAKVTFGSDTAPIRKSGAPVGARRRYGMRKAGDALQGAKKAAGSAYKTAKSKAAGAAVDVAVAGSMAKKKAGEVKKAAQEAPGKAKAAVTTAASDAKKKAKSGIKGFIKRQAQKVVSRMSEETVEELYKGKHGQTEKQYQDGRSDAGKMVSGDSKMSGSKYAQGRRTGSDAGPQPAGGSKKPESQGKMDRGSRIDLQFRKAALKKEELEATGLFTAKEIEALVESENVDEAITSEKGKAKMKSMIDARTTDSGRAKPGKGQNVKDIQHIGRANVDGLGGTPPNRKTAKNPVKSRHYGGTGNKAERRADALTRNEEFVDEAMSSYDRNRKRAAQRAADRNAARAAGKTGVVPGVGYVTPNKERETYTDEKGTVRHKSGAKNEEFELDENRRAARAAGGYKDDSKKQTDPSKAGFTGISNSIADIMKQNKEIEARKKK